MLENQFGYRHKLLEREELLNKWKIVAIDLIAQTNLIYSQSIDQRRTNKIGF